MRNIGKIITISQPLYRIFAVVVLLILASSALELASPLLSKSIVDEIVKQISQKSGNFNFLGTLVILTFLLNFLGIIANALSDRLGDHLAGELRSLLTERFYNKVLSLPQSYFDSEISGKIVNQLSRGIFTIQGFVNASTNFIFPTFLQSALTIIVLLRYNTLIAGLVFILFPIYLFLSYISSKKWGEAEVIKNRFEDTIRGRIQEAVSNMKIVKGFSQEQSEYSFVAGNLKEINRIYAAQSSTYHRIDFLRNLSLIVVLLGINMIVFFQAFAGTLTIGEMVLIIQLVLQARRPLFAMSFILTQLQNAESGSKEFFEILELTQKEDFKATTLKNSLKNPSLEFRDVTFKYKDSDQVLNDVSFKLQAREKVALVGHSGAGKTTVTNLILKLYTPTAGKIFLGTKNYAGLTVSDVRRHIGLVFQDNELFSTSIRDNVTYGSKATDEEIRIALKQANAWDFVQKMPQGLNSLVGEKGIKLSGGQKQRIQIARAILKNAPILILDEATSSLDAKSENEVQDALEKLMANKLVIIIAHRFSTLQNVDRVIVLNDGTIEEEGTPKELAKKPGLYSDLLRFQIEGNKKLLEGYEMI